MSIARRDMIFPETKQKGDIHVNRHEDAPMTALSNTAFTAATMDGLTAQSATVALMERVQIRSFRDILVSLADESRLQALLVDGLCANDASRVRGSVVKKVHDWLSGKYQPTRREDLWELCFILRLSESQADFFLASASDEGIHWREPQELAFAFALNKGMSYPEAVLLFERVKPTDTASDDTPESFTPLIRQEAQRCQTEAELREYLRAASGKLGSLHNMAYQHFMSMLQLLDAPESLNGQTERHYTTREIVDEYLDRRLPSAREGKKLDEKRRCILADWPDEVILSRMKNRKVDVNRKVLLLLFLATDIGDEPENEWSDDGFYNDEENDEPAEDFADAAFRSTHMRINQMLADCGFRLLDPRNAFDWLVIYCMRASYADDETMDGLNEHLTHVLDALFAASRQET